MTLKEYLAKYKITVTEFAARCKLSSTSLWFYFSGRRTPTQKTAERIEKESDGLVTVKTLRGKDARCKEYRQLAEQAKEAINGRESK